MGMVCRHHGNGSGRIHENLIPASAKIAGIAVSCLPLVDSVIKY